MHWVPGQPAILTNKTPAVVSVDGRVLPPITIPMPAVHPPRDEGVDPQIVRDLVGLLLRATRKLPEEDAFRKVVHDYLRRKGLQGNGLRTVETDKGTP